MLYELSNISPELKGENIFIAPGAHVIGKVTLQDFVSIWFNAVVRGDDDQINIGSHTNVQDGAVIHTDPGIQCTIGNYVTIGHRAILHGCTIGDETIVGMGATILNRAVIGSQCIIGAGAVIPEGVEIPPKSLVLGMPGKVKRELSEEQIKFNRLSAEYYALKIEKYSENLVMPEQ